MATGELKKYDSDLDCPKCKVKMDYQSSYFEGNRLFDIFKCPSCGKTETNKAKYKTE